MKWLRAAIIRALVLALACTPSLASQSNLVMPTTGPMSMATFAGTYLTPALMSLASCHSGTSAPTNATGGAPVAGQCWWDTTAATWIKKEYDGATWIEIGRLDTAGNFWNPTIHGTNISGITGTGNAVLATSPVLVTPNLGTPSAGVLTNAAVLAPLTGAGMARSVLVSHPIDAADTTCHWFGQTVRGTR